MNKGIVLSALTEAFKFECPQATADEKSSQTFTRGGILQGLGKCI